MITTNDITPADIEAFEKVLRHRFQEDVTLALEEDGMTATPAVVNPFSPPCPIC